MIPSDLWEEELTAAAASTGVPRSDLEAAMRAESDPQGQGPGPGADPPDGDGRLAESASRLLISAADALSRSLTGDALANAFGVLVLVAELFDVPRLRQWTSRLSVAEDRGPRARGAARILLEAAASLRAARDIEVLRQREWEWPEILAEAPPLPPPPDVPGRPPEAVRPVGAPAETLPSEEPEAEPPPAETVPPTGETPPAPEEVHAAPPPAPAAFSPRTRPRALVVDRSGIAAGFLARLLAQRGIEVAVTTDPAACGPLAEGGLEFLFLDADLPGDAAQALLAAHPEWRERAVLVGMDPGRRRAAEVAGLPFVLKPPSDEDITHVLASLVARRTPMGPAPGAKGDA